jgi:hypothetical protein
VILESKQSTTSLPYPGLGYTPSPNESDDWSQVDLAAFFQSITVESKTVDGSTVPEWVTSFWTSSSSVIHLRAVYINQQHQGCQTDIQVAKPNAYTLGQLPPNYNPNFYGITPGDGNALPYGVDTSCYSYYSEDDVTSVSNYKNRETYCTIIPTESPFIFTYRGHADISVTDFSLYDQTNSTGQDLMIACPANTTLNLQQLLSNAVPNGALASSKGSSVWTFQANILDIQN